MVVIATVLWGVLGAGCGGSQEARSPAMHASAVGRGGAAVTTGGGAQVGVTSEFSAPIRDGDGDGDSRDGGLYDRDDSEVISYGQAGTVGDERQAAKLVARYLAASVAGDGVKACSLMYSLFAEVIPEEYGEPPGSPALRGKTCAVVMTKMFRRDSRRMADGHANLRVLGVRFRGDRGLALLGVRTRVESYLLMHRESGAWKVAAIGEEGVS